MAHREVQKPIRDVGTQIYYQFGTKRKVENLK